MCPNSVESWKTLRQAAEIRRHEEILAIAVNSPDEIPEVYYHRKCRSIFTMKKDLHRIHANEKTESRKDTESAEGGEGERRASIRGTPSTSRVYEKVCIFCKNKDKYKKGSRTRESLTQARQLRTGSSVRNAAELKMDSRVLASALLSRELIAAEAHYHPLVIDSTQISAAPVVNFPLNKMKIQLMNLMLMLSGWPWPN